MTARAFRDASTPVYRFVNHDEVLLRAFLDQKLSSTAQAYKSSLRLFHKFLQGRKRAEPSAVAVVTWLQTTAASEADQLVANWRDSLVHTKSPATAAVRVAAVLALAKFMRANGIISHDLHVARPKVHAYCDTGGVGGHGALAILQQIRQQGDTLKARRDLALVLLMFGLGLRRGQVIALDLEDIQLPEQRIFLTRWGRGNARHVRSVPAPIVEALRRWIAVRGTQPGPLFIRLDHAATDGTLGRLGGRSLWHLVQRRGFDVGIRAGPMRLRHAAVTAFLDRRHGDLRAAAHFAEHANLNTTARYDDNRLASSL